MKTPSPIDPANVKPQPTDKQRIAELLTQRDSLKSALEALINACHRQGHGWVPKPDGIHATITVHQDTFSEADTQARAALALVKEGM